MLGYKDKQRRKDELQRRMYEDTMQKAKVTRLNW